MTVAWHVLVVLPVAFLYALVAVGVYVSVRDEKRDRRLYERLTGSRYEKRRRR